jgi:alpha,alpha-trehalase
LDAEFEFEWGVTDSRILSDVDRAEVLARSAVARERLGRVCYPQIPSVDELHLPLSAPAPLRPQFKPSPGLASPLLEEARKLKVHPDFKYLSDLQRSSTTPDYAHWQREFTRAAQCEGFEERRAVLKKYIECAYEPEPVFAPAEPALVAPRWTLDHPDAKVRQAFSHIENHWGVLVKSSVSESGGSLIQSPYPFLIPAGRFRESYYWDTCFGVDGLLASGRLELARMQADNLLENIRRFGFVPNGSRDYYLTRSQLPLSASMIRKIVEASHAEFAAEGNAVRMARLHLWVAERAVPLLEREFLDFWSDPETRFDAATGLHHHWDQLDIKRPERFSADDEDHLGASFRDVRASAESGLDFTDMYSGRTGLNEMSQIAPVMLNAVLCGFSRDLSWLAEFCGMDMVREKFMGFHQQRSLAIDRHLWDESSGVYRHYHLKDRSLSSGLCFTAYAPLFADICTPARAARVAAVAAALESRGGICASTLCESTHQWDGSNGWAPAQMIAITGLLNFGYAEDARRLAEKWLETLAGIFERHGQFFERVDVDARDIPGNGYDKYPVQEGFLWTNASFVWILTRVLGFGLKPVEL